MQADSSRLNTGKTGELHACKYLKDNGYIIIDRNFKTPIGEIDIIAKKGGIIHFFEVKTRRGLNFGNPFEAITPLKKRRIRRTAEWYNVKRGWVSALCLFGVIGIDLSCDPPAIECIVDAFE